MIDLVYRTVQVLLNKNGQGVITPDRFNTLAETAQWKVFSTLQDELRQVLNRKKQGYSANTEREVRSAISGFETEATITETDGVFVYPEDAIMIESVYFRDREVEIVPKGRFRSLQVDAMYPICALRENREIVVRPLAINEIDIVYIRKPLTPNWTYVTYEYSDEWSMDAVEFNPSDEEYQDFELPETYLPKIVWEMTTLLGLHLKESEILQIAETEKQRLTKEETTL